MGKFRSFLRWAGAAIALWVVVGSCGALQGQTMPTRTVSIENLDAVLGGVPAVEQSRRSVYRTRADRLPPVQEVRTTVRGSRTVVRRSRTGVDVYTRIPICPRGRIWSRWIGACTSVDVHGRHERDKEEVEETDVRSDTLRYNR